MSSSDWDDLVMREGDPSDLGALENRGSVLVQLAEHADFLVGGSASTTRRFLWQDVRDALSAYLATRDDCHALVSDRISDSMLNMPSVGTVTVSPYLDVPTRLLGLDQALLALGQGAEDPFTPWHDAASLHNAVMRIRPLGAYNLIAAQTVAYWTLRTSGIDFPHIVVAPQLRHEKRSLTIKVYEKCVLEAVQERKSADAHLRYHLMAQRYQSLEGADRSSNRSRNL